MTAPEPTVRHGPENRLGPATVLMYHAVINPAASVDTDPHYSITETAFATHLDVFARCGRVPTSVQRLIAQNAVAPAVALTFDDGHVSNAYVAERLALSGGSADFFINSSTVGEKNVLSWSQLRAMSAAGMSIQSHAATHRLMDELTDAEVREELIRSKHAIEDGIGHAVELFAPPGGRMRPGLVGLATSVGYRAVCSSRAGIWSRATDSREIPRLAVLASTPLRRLALWVEQDRIELSRAQLRHAALAAAKRVLPRPLYEDVREVLTGWSRRGADG